MHILVVARGITLGNLRVECHHEVAHEALHHIIDRCSDASRGIEHHAEEEVHQNIDTLRIEHPRAVAQHAPTCEARHFLHQSFILNDLKTTLLKVAQAVNPIDNRG